MSGSTFVSSSSGTPEIDTSGFGVSGSTGGSGAGFLWVVSVLTAHEKAKSTRTQTRERRTMMGTSVSYLACDRAGHKHHPQTKTGTRSLVFCVARRARIAKLLGCEAIASHEPV